MEIPQLLGIMGVISVATLFGSMAFFSCVIAPLVFIELDAEIAGRFIRRLFPWYYVVIVALSLLATISFAFTNQISAVIMGLVFVGACISREVLMPRINRRRDEMIQGNSDAEDSFNRLHRASVLINGVQLIAVFVILLRSII